MILFKRKGRGVLPQARPARGSFLLATTTHGNQADLLLAQLDLERIAWLEVELVGVGPAPLWKNKLI